VWKGIISEKEIAMSDKDKESIISEISDEYKITKMLGKNPNMQEYLKRCPIEYIQELKGDIEDWEWLIGWKYEGSAEEISQYRINGLIARLQPKLDTIEIKQLGEKISKPDE